MALRVLLADESSTIKKVFQLALQDFAVDVRPVNVGNDVITVAQSFKPDIIFADVLLQKKSGYEVASEIKGHSSLKNIPVVLMWSGFMELDEDKFQASAANAQLEKPFDVTALRKLVSELVPRTQGQRLSQFLSFPQMPEMQEPAQEAAQPEAEREEDFEQVPIPKMKEKYKVDLKPEELDPENIPVSIDESAMDEVLGSSDEADGFTLREAPKAKPKAPPPAPQPAMAASAQPSVPTLTEAQLEKIIRAQSAEMIESVVWKVIPDLATQIIERELNRLLKERDTLMR